MILLLSIECMGTVRTWMDSSTGDSHPVIDSLILIECNSVTLIIFRLSTSWELYVLLTTAQDIRSGTGCGTARTAW